jgi:uncharacterized membrane protein YphA (DoxX/SURF4 family)
MRTKIISTKSISWTHTIVTIILALFFLNAGIQKFIPKPARTADNTKLVKAVVNETYEAPYAFYLSIKAMKKSGFLHVIGVFQILAAILMIVPKTRLLGLVVLLPIIVNIFLLHFFLHQDLEENIETGLLVLTTVILMIPFHQKIKTLLQD